MGLIPTVLGNTPEDSLASSAGRLHITRLPRQLRAMAKVRAMPMRDRWRWLP
jgi:hypothetical protein